MDRGSCPRIIYDLSLHFCYTPYQGITTRTPAVTDVFGSGRNVGALRPGRRVGFRSLAQGLADDIYWEHIIFVTPTALLLLQLGPNSKQGKLSGDHCRFFQCI